MREEEVKRIKMEGRLKIEVNRIWNGKRIGEKNGLAEKKRMIDEET